MSGIPDHQAPCSVCNNERCDHKHQEDSHVPIFGKEAYKIITTLEDASLWLGHECSIFTGPYSCQPSHATIEEVQKNIQRLQEMVEQLGKLFEKIDKTNTDQETKDLYKQIYTSVSERYLSHI
jgi:G:T-mismatch repair DNA endonuclease (very short patch repair protein)